MAEFTLRIRDGNAVTSDPHAYEFPTAQDAWNAAVRALRQGVSQTGAAFAGKQIEIADVTGHSIAVVHPHDVATA